MKDFKGLYTDASYLKNPKGTWQNAKNILLTKQFNSPVNENGTKFSHLIRGEVVGMIETNREVVYFSKVVSEVPGMPNSLISVYNLDDNILEEKLEGNFGFDRPIEGVYKYDYKTIYSVKTNYKTINK